MENISWIISWRGLGNILLLFLDLLFHLVWKSQETAWTPSEVLTKSLLKLSKSQIHLEAVFSQENSGFGLCPDVISHFETLVLPGGTGYKKKRGCILSYKFLFLTFPLNSVQYFSRTVCSTSCSLSACTLHTQPKINQLARLMIFWGKTSNTVSVFSSKKFCYPRQ